MINSRLSLINDEVRRVPKIVVSGPDKTTVANIINICEKKELPVIIKDTENDILDCDICIITGIDGDTKESLIKIIKDVNKNNILLFNADDADLMDIISYNKFSTVISVGFNSKATITASSMKQSLKGIDFNYCLQRKLGSLNGTNIEPFEYPVEIKQINQKYIYYYLLAITSLLILGYNIEYIKDKIKKVTIKDEMKILYNFGYYIVEYKLSKNKNADEVFITIQSLDHGNLYIINALKSDINFLSDIESWQNILTIKKIYNVSADEYLSKHLNYDNAVWVSDIKTALQESIRSAKNEDIILIFEESDANIGNLIYDITVN